MQFAVSRKKQFHDFGGIKSLEYSQYNYRKCSRNLPAQMEECEVETFLSGIGDGAGEGSAGCGGGVNKVNRWRIINLLRIIEDRRDIR